MKDPLASTRAGAQRWPSGERARAHAKTRAKRRRNAPQKIAAARAAAVVDERTGDVRAQPVATRFTERIDALHGQAGQILHCVSLSGRKSQADQIARIRRGRAPWRPSPGTLPSGRPESTSKSVPRFRPGPHGDRANDGGDCAAGTLWCQEKRLQDIVVRLQRARPGRGTGKERVPAGRRAVRERQAVMAKALFAYSFMRARNDAAGGKCQ
jgi:hypothetical protein